MGRNSSMSESKRTWRTSLGVGVVLVALLASAVGVIALTGAGGLGAATTPAVPGLSAGAPQAHGPLTQVQPAASPTAPSLNGFAGTINVVSDASALNLAAPLTVTVVMKASSGLSSFVSDLSNPASPEYRAFVSASQLAAYGPGATNYAALVNYLSGFGLSVTPSSSQLSLSVTGSVSALEAAFHTTITLDRLAYVSQGQWMPEFGNASAVKGSTTYGQPFVVNTGSLSLPASVAGAVSAIVGLAGGQATPMVMMPTGMSPSTSAPAGTNPSAFSPQQNQQYNFYTSVDQVQNISYGNFTWTEGNLFSFDCEFYGIGCSNIQTLYPSTVPYATGAYNLWGSLSTGGLVAGGAPSTGLSSEPDLGQGITIGIVEVGCAFPSDIAGFSQQAYGTPNQLLDRVTQIAVNGSILPGFTGYNNNNLNNCLGAGEDYGWTLETMLDLEYASSMAPDAHIDIIAVPNAQFSSFDEAYALMAQYLTGGASACANLPSSLVVVSGGTNGACALTIDSNSYGEGEMYQVLDGSPMYATATDTLLQELNAVGVTNFFAAGDSGGVGGLGTVDSFQSADALGSTAVGGGQLTVADVNGNPFPYTNSLICDYVLDGSCYYYFGDSPTFVAQARGISSFTYWSYGEGIGGTYTGIEGGGFGQSQLNPQPWWQNALDTFSSGSREMPQLSNAAAFNMTIYVFGTWYTLYGGTSFATPITAGEWALVEQQAELQPAAKKAMGDINPIIYDVHNAYEAGVSTIVGNGQPYTDMSVMPQGSFNANWNSFTWYYYNLSIQNPSAPYVPFWFPSLGNPAGSGWNYLQGLGLVNVNVVSADVMGMTNAPYSLADQPFTVMEQTANGLVPFTDLTGGTTYNLQIVLADGGAAGSGYTISAYSGGTNTGTYGGGTVTTITPSSTGSFSYTPTYTVASYDVNATEYGYLEVQVSNGVSANPEWSFQYFAVAEAPLTSGSLSLCVATPEGTCNTTTAEVTMFTLTQTGYYNLWPQAYVSLNGQMQAEALVSQVAVNVSQYALEDPTLPTSTYAPGTLLGTYISDERGSITFWGNAFVTENNGPLYPNVFTLVAHYRGLTSNTVTVYVEPQSGNFDPQLTFSSGSSTAGSGSITGTVGFAGMKYVNWVNVSAGSSPGQYMNVSYPPAYFDSNAGIWESGIDAGILSVDLTNLSSTGAVVNITAEGVNDLSFEYCFSGFCFGTLSVQDPMYWMDPLVYVPTSLSLGTSGPVTGTVALNYAAGSLAGHTLATQLTLSWAGGSEVLPISGLSGSYALDTTHLADGYYTATFSAVAAGLSQISDPASVTFQVVNTAVTLTNEVSALTSQLQADATTISNLQSTVANLNSQVASLKGQLNTAQATITSLQSEQSQLSGEVSSLTSALSQAQATVNSLQSTIAQLQATNSADQQTLANLNAALTASQSLVQSLQGKLSTAQSQLASDAAQIAQLEQELSSKKTPGTSLAWYQAPAAIVGLVAIGILVAGFAVYAATRRPKSRGSGQEVPSETPSTPTNGATVAPEAPVSSAAARRAAQDEAMTETFRRSVITTLQASIQRQKALMNLGQFDEALNMNREAHSLAFEVFGRH